MLRTIVTETRVTEALNNLPDAVSPVMDEFYPVALRRVHPSSSIRIDEISKIAKAVPVVMRGSMPVSIGSEHGSINKIEPQPIDVVDSITGAELNDLKNYDGTSQDLWLESKMLFARDTIKMTSEALCIQSLSGTINFPMKTDSGLEEYEIKFGDVLLVTPTKKLNESDATIKDVFSTIRSMKRKLKENGRGGAIVYKASPDVFDKIVELADKYVQTGSLVVKVEEDSVIVGGFKIVAFDEQYYDPKTKTLVNGIGNGKLKAISKAGFAFRYLALDDIDAGLKAIPLFSKPIKREIPSGWIINTMSKPLPIPDPKGICDAILL